MLEDTMYRVRNLLKDDIEQLIPLYARFCQETLSIVPTLTADTVKRDGFGAKFDFVVSEESKTCKIVGFAAWQSGYDLHWGISGGIILDLYVEPTFRCQGLAPRMLNKIAAIIKASGGTFLAGQGIVGPTHPERMYQKYAVGCPGVDCILGGKAFRTFAELEFKSMKQFIRALPPKEWNHVG